MAYQGFSFRTAWRSTSFSGLGLAVLVASTTVLTPPSIALPTATAPLTVAQIPAGATVIYVNPASGQDVAGAGTSEATPTRSITYALQQARAGTVILLARGSYTQATGEVFPLQVPPGVTLRGSEGDKGQTVAVIGGGNFISRSFARQNMTILALGNSEIRGLTVTNPNTRGTGIWVESSNPTIENCTFTSNKREGVFIAGTGNPRIVQNVFSRNDGNGISVANNAKGEIRSNVFQNTGFGLAVGGTSTPLIASNRIIENTDGVYINDNARPVLRGNVIENNQRDGIVATIAAKPDLGTAQEAGGNVIQNNGKFDLNNSTRDTIYSVGNTLSTARISGQVQFVAASGSGGTSAFSDVQGHWAQAYIDALAQRNIISGFPGGVFRPSDPVTRVQFAAIISKAFTPAARQSAVQFRDVSTSFWGYSAIQSAVQGGFMRGYPEGIFQPDQRIPRVQVLVALATGLGFTPTDLTVLSRFQDAAEIPSWATNAVAAATQRKVVINYPTLSLITPNREATRAEVAAIVYQALVNAGTVEPIASPYLVSVP